LSIHASLTRFASNILEPTTTKRINLWSSPRNISTALLYSLAQRKDARVVDEPLYAHYLLRQPTAAKHPGRAAIIASQEGDGETVVQRMLGMEYGKPIVFFKQMTHHLVELDLSFLDRMDNVLLIRDPRAILTSFNKVINEVTAADIGIPQQYALFQRLRESGKLAAVLDARLLLKNPVGVLRSLCGRLDIPFSEAMLNWEAGARPEDGVWASHWYANVHRSSGFRPYRKKPFDLSPEMSAIARACQPAYEAMLAVALR